MNFTTGQELLTLCERQGISIAEGVRQRELFLFDSSLQATDNIMKDLYHTMEQSVKTGLETPQKSMGGLLGGQGAGLLTYGENANSASGSFITKAVAYALSVLEVNASMGLVVAAPTGGACGVIPGCFVALQQEHKLSEQAMVNALFTAGGVGYLIMRHASVSGAECGCQAEIGSAAAMAAAGVVAALGGTPQQALDAAAIALTNLMGLVCDPVAGLVEVPCHSRNGIGVTNALISADMVLSGMKSFVPFDEVVAAMYRVGLAMPYELRETALGGLAATPTATEYAKAYFCDGCR